MTSPLNFAKGFYLTDGGLETSLIFHQGVNLPHFAAFILLNELEGRNALRNYYIPYLQIARRYKLYFILETPTWRANTDWGIKLGYSPAEIQSINRKAVRFAHELKSFATDSPSSMLISGNVGPRGDGYAIDHKMTVEQAHQYHLPQLLAFVREGVDLVTAMTINYREEGIGIVRAAEEVAVPVVVSFTVDTDGQLPSGESLQKAIEETDQATNQYASHYMINCAHPEHFEAVLKSKGQWKQRIRGVRANASTKSHAELDEAETLDMGDKSLLAEGYMRLKALLPNLRIIGGCCGTDHTHLEEVCQHFFDIQID